MKTIKIIVISMLCALSVSSCQKNYSRLIIGDWRIDADASYLVENGRRKYDEIEATNMQFFADGEVEITYDDAEKSRLKYHLDGDYIYMKGDAAHIIKLNSKRMVLESSDYGHIELWRWPYWR